MRLGLVGCAGTGKSGLAEGLASSLNLPYLASKEVTNDILRRDGYDYGSGEQVEKFLASYERQIEIFERLSKMHSAEAFVTDRTGIDLAAYTILEMEGALRVQNHLEKCRELVRRYTHILYCPWTPREIVDNQKRTLDPWYQFTVHSVQMTVSRQLFGVEMYVFESENFEERLKEAVELLHGNSI
jgi:nicotinamide riboside kinase